jgi:hypothetical protein
VTGGAGLVVVSQFGVADDLGIGGPDDHSAEVNRVIQRARAQIPNVDAGRDECERGPGTDASCSTAAAVWQSSTVAMMPPLRKPNPLSCSGHGVNVAVTQSSPT